VIDAGVDPAALVEVINDVQSELAAAQAELDSITEPETLTDAEIYAVIDSLGDVGATLTDARPAGLSRLLRVTSSGASLTNPGSGSWSPQRPRVVLTTVSEAGVAHYPYASPSTD
jgi:hypothetical protein